MTPTPRPPFLYVITDRATARGGDVLGVVRGVARAAARLGEEGRGRLAVQVRARELLGRACLELCERVRDLCEGAGVAVLVNDRADVALAAGLAGVHLPAHGLTVEDARALLPEGWVAASTHREAEVEAAARAGADLVTFGPVFSTPSKASFGPPPGPGRLAAAREAAAAGARAAGRARRPLVLALGGIEGPERAREVVAAGADGVGCIRGVMASADPEAAVLSFLRAMEG